MVEDIKDATPDKPVFSSSKSANKQEVNIFPALTDRRSAPISSMRQAPTRIGTQISIFSPVSFEEALDIVECLRSRAATTISLENMKKLDASRLVDFVAGASAALDGDFHKLSEQVYIFCPSNIKITAPGKNVQAAATAGFSAGAFDLAGAAGLDFLYPSQPDSPTAWS